MHCLECSSQTWNSCQVSNWCLSYTRTNLILSVPIIHKQECASRLVSFNSSQSCIPCTYKCPKDDKHHNVIKVSLLLFLVAELLLRHVFSDMAESSIVSTLNWDRGKIFWKVPIIECHSQNGFLSRWLGVRSGT